MKIIKCKICGHEIKSDDNEEYVRCESCGSYNEVSIKILVGTLRCIRCNTPLDLKKVKDGVLECSHCHQVMTFTKDNQADNVISVIKRGKECLDISNFDEAYNLFTKAIELDPSEPEGYFNRALARFKVQYLRDLVNRRMQPICHLVSDKIFSEDSDYKKSLELAKDTQKREYQRKANEIDEIKREFAKLEAQGIDYDCFICVKVTDDYRNKTEDCYQANDIYYKLKDNKIEPFFSERILANYSGGAYEAHILYALYKAKCMLLVCSDEKYLDTPWVKNEYTRFKSLIDAKEKEEGSLCIVYNQKPIEHIPTVNVRLQGIDLNNKFAMLDIVNYIKRFCKPKEAKQSYGFNGEYSSDNVLRRVNILKLSNRKEEAINLLLDAVEKDYSNYKIWDTLFELYLSDKGNDVTIMSLYDEALNSLSDEDRKLFQKKYSYLKIEREFDKYFEYVIKADDSISITKCLDKSIEELIIPSIAIINGDLHKVSSIGGNAFRDLNSLVRVIISENIETIGGYSFVRCENLKEVIIKNGVKYIYMGAFSDCKSLETIDLPNSLLELDDEVFSNCESLQTITIPKNINVIKYRLLYGCKSLKKVILIGKICKIEDSAFCGCEQLENLVSFDKSESIDEIEVGDSSFAECKCFKHLQFVVKGVGNRAFSFCKFLESISISKQIKEIGEGAFEFCKSLERVYYNGSLRDWLSIDFKFNNNNRHGIFGVESNPLWNNSHFLIFDGNANYKEITEVIIPYDIKILRNNVVFSHANSVLIPSDIKEIEHYRFNEFNPNFKLYCESSSIIDLVKLDDYKKKSIIVTDMNQIINYYFKNAEQNNVCAQYNLGFCYKNGQGVQRDISKAKYWFTKAAENGNEEAKKLLKNL